MRAATPVDADEMARADVAYDTARLEETCRRLQLRMVVLFGSRATGSPPPLPESDLDLAVLGSKPGGEARYPDWVKELSKVFPAYLLDLALLGRADPLFRYEIFRQGIMLYGDLDDFYEYKIFATRSFMEASDLRALEEVLFKKRMAYIRRHLHGSA